MDELDICGIILCVFNYFILVPVILYGLWCYKLQKKHSNIIKNRDNFLTNAIHAFIIIGTLIERTFLICVRVWHIVDIKYLWVFYLLFSICWYGAADLFAIKVFILYFQQKYHISVSERSWKRDINPNNNDWYIKNKNTFGNVSYLLKITFIPYLLSIITTGFIFPFFSEGLALDFTILIVTGIPFCIALITFWKARSVNDIYYIRNEVFYQCIIIIFVLIIYLILFLVTHFNVYLTTKYPVNILRFEWAGYVIITDVGAVSLGIVSTYYPIYILKKKKEEIMLVEQQSFEILSAIPKTTNNHSNRSDHSDHSHGNHTHTNLQDMNQILSNYKLFKLFMSYIVSEFSAENGLFLVEFIQCKHNYQMRNNFLVKAPTSMGKTDEFIIIDFNINPFNQNEKFRTEKEKYFTYLFHSDCEIMTKLSLPTEIPKTIILTKYADNMFQQMNALYTKYVKVGSDHELNLSCSVRTQLENVFDADSPEYSESDYFNVMDECAIEVTGLMQQSFVRFANTGIFKSIEINQCKSDASLKELLNSDKSGIVKRTTKE